jgi:predicted nucleotidyltransferase
MIRSRPEVLDALSTLYDIAKQGEWLLSMKDAERLSSLADQLHLWADIQPQTADLRRMANAVTDLIATRRLSLEARAVLVARLDDQEVRFMVETTPDEIRLYFEGFVPVRTKQKYRLEPGIHVRLTSEGNLYSRQLSSWLDRAKEANRNGGAMLEELSFQLPA